MRGTLTKPPIKIFYTTHQFFPDFRAGTELLTYSLSDAMRNKNHSVHIISGFPVRSAVDYQTSFNEYLYDNLKVYCYYHSSFHPVGKQCVMEAEHNNRIVKKWFKKLLLDLRPDIVHVFHLKRLSASILEACQELGIPYVITITDFWLICPTTQLLLPNQQLCKGPSRMMVNCARHLTSLSSNHLVSKIANKLPDEFIKSIMYLLSFQPKLRVGPFANMHSLFLRPSYVLQLANNAKRIYVSNQFMRNMLVDHGILSKRIKTMPFGIQPLNFASHKLKKVNDVLKVGFIGTLNHHKGAHVLIRAIRALPQFENIHLSIYGDRKQFPEYVSMLDNLSMRDPRIEFKGTFPIDQIGKILAQFDVLVLPSLWYENTPLILLQAQAAKLPVIATNLGGMNEIVKNGLNGFLIEPGDYQKLASILESLILAPEQIPTLRQNIRKPTFIDQYADLMEEEYHELVGR